MILERDIERYLVRRTIEHGGVVWFVELKTVKGRLSPWQKLFAAEMRRMGMNYIVIRSKGEVDAYFDSM